MICRLIQFRAGLRLDDHRPLPLSLERHIAHCPRCAAWHQAQREVAGQLRQQWSAAASPVRGAEPSPLLQEKILRAITAPAPRPRPAPAVSTDPGGNLNLWFRWVGGATVAAAAMVAAAMLINRNPDSATAPQTVQNGAGRTSSRPHKAFTAHDKSTAGAKPGNPLMAAAENFDKPLRRELALLNEDARSAVRALKASFLPPGVLPMPGTP
jgi:hypothetical protein